MRSTFCRVAMVVLGFAVLFLPQMVQAQPPVYVDLGVISDTSGTYAIPDFQVTPTITTNVIQWYQFTLNESTSASGVFFDIDTMATGSTGQVDTEIGIYDNAGNLVANDDDDGHSVRSALSFGNTTPRTMPPDPYGFTNGLDANGRDGDLVAGVYWLAVGQFNVTFNPTNWDVTSSATGPGTSVEVNFRTDAMVPVELMSFSVE